MKSKVHAVRLIVTLILTTATLAGCTDKDKNKICADTQTGVDTPLADQVSDVAETENLNDKPLTIAMVGDIMMGTTFPEGGHNLTADDGATLFKDAVEILRRADIAAGNLEGSLFDGKGVPKPCYNPERWFVFRMPERYVKHLTDAGFDFVGIANNHINDLGPEAKARTQEVLKAANLPYAGDREKQPTVIVEKDGRKIGFVAFGFDRGMPSIHNSTEIDSLVGNLKKQCDFVVVSFHGGAEGKNFQHVTHKKEPGNRGNVEEFAHRAVDAGADVVYGHSPHVPRAAELYKDRIIFYSLGNFCTPYRFNVEGVNGLAPLAHVTLNADGTFHSGKIHSFVQKRGVGPRLDHSNAAARKIKELTKSDFPSTSLVISDEGEMSRK